jgi:ABC-2 type transport system ATP-binding protein
MSTTLIQINHLNKQFDDVTAISDLSINIVSGGVLGLLGPKGAGKTTLVKLICGLEQPSGGEIQYFFSNDGNNGIKKYIGYCPEENILWPQLSCYEQLVFTGKMYDLNKRTAHERAEYYLAQLGLSDKRNQKANHLSRGMKRRLNIALALMNDPEIVILDEPLTGLDAQNTILIREFIKNLSLHKTIIFCTQDMDEADKLCERIAIMDHGSILLINSPAKLKNSVGGGDILQLSMAGDVSNVYDQLVKLLPGDVYVSFASNNKISIRSKDLVNYIPQISELVKREHGKILNMELRSNTLEDVFIQLTGRSLRN